MKTSTPLFAAILVATIGIHLVSLSILSVVAQTFDELLVLCGNSTDSGVFLACFVEQESECDTTSENTTLVDDAATCIAGALANGVVNASSPGVIEILRGCTAELVTCVNALVPSIPDCVTETTSVLSRCAWRNADTCGITCLGTIATGIYDDEDMNVLALSTCAELQREIVDPLCDVISCCSECVDEMLDVTECLVNEVLFSNRTCDFDCANAERQLQPDWHLDDGHTEISHENDSFGGGRGNGNGMGNGMNNGGKGNGYGMGNSSGYGGWQQAGNGQYGLHPHNVVLSSCRSWISDFANDTEEHGKLSRSTDVFQCMMTAMVEIITVFGPTLIEDDDDDSYGYWYGYGDHGHHERAFDWLLPRCSHSHTIPWMANCIEHRSPLQCINETVLEDVGVCLLHELLNENVTYAATEFSNEYDDFPMHVRTNVRRIDALEACTATIVPCINDTIHEFLESRVDQCLRRTTHALARCGRQHRVECRESCSAVVNRTRLEFDLFTSDMVDTCQEIQENIIAPSCNQISCCPACLDEMNALNECVMNNIMGINNITNENSSTTCGITCPSPVDNLNTTSGIVQVLSADGGRWLQTAEGDVADDDEADEIYRTCAVATPGVTGERSAEELASRAIFFDCVVEELLLAITSNEMHDGSPNSNGSGDGNVDHHNMDHSGNGSAANLQVPGSVMSIIFSFLLVAVTTLI